MTRGRGWDSRQTTSSSGSPRGCSRTAGSSCSGRSWRKWRGRCPTSASCCSADPETTTAVRRILVRAVTGFYCRHGKRLDLPRPQPGAVIFEQRFDSALKLNLHFHGLWTDGVFTWSPGNGQPTFHPHHEVADTDVADLVRSIRDRVLRMLRKRGKLPADDECAPADDPANDDPDLLQVMTAAAVQGRTTAGARDPRLGRGTAAEPFVKGRLAVTSTALGSALL